MSNHVCEICHPRSFQHVHGAMKRKAFITVAMVRSPDPSCWYPRSHVGRSLPPYLALPPSVPPPPAHSSQLLWPSRCSRRTLRSLFPPVQAPFPLRRPLPTRPPSLSRYSSLPPGLCSKATSQRLPLTPSATAALAPRPESVQEPIVHLSSQRHAQVTHGGLTPTPAGRSPHGVGSWFCFALPRASYQAWARIWPTPPPPVTFCAPALTRFSSLVNPQSDKIYVLPLPPLRGVIHEGSDFTWPPAVCLVPVCAVDIGGPPWSPPHGA